MPPKEKKKNNKDLVKLAGLTALATTYKAACRNAGVAQDKGLGKLIETAILDGKGFDKISFSGPACGPGSVKAALELLAGYSLVKNLACWSCSLGDEGLCAIAGLIRASGAKWWKGSKLCLLELVADRSGKALESWPATYMAHMSGALAVKGQSHAQPSFLMDPTATRVTSDTLRLQQAGMTQSSVVELEAAFDTSHAAGGSLISLTYDTIQIARATESITSQQLIASGALAGPPTGGYSSGSARVPASTGNVTLISRLARSGLPLLSLGKELPVGGSRDSRDGLPGVDETAETLRQEEVGESDQGEYAFDLSSGVAPPSGVALARVMKSVRVWASQAALQATIAPHQPGTGTIKPTPVGLEGTGTPGGRFTWASESGKAPSSMGRSTGVGVGAAPPVPAGLSTWQGATSASTSEVFSYARPACQPGYLTSDPLAAPCTMNFSVEALQALGSALGSVGHGLQVLVLDHNHLGDLGMHTLVEGLRRCVTLKQLSLENCGLGATGAAALASVLVPDETPLHASLQPKLVHLNLSRNPLGGQGVAALCEGIAFSPSLQILNVSSVGLTEDDMEVLEALGDALFANKTIAQVDIDGNFIGDLGAAAFIPLLSHSQLPHLRKFRMSARGQSKDGAISQCIALVRAKFPKAKKKGRAGGKSAAVKKQ